MSLIPLILFVQIFQFQFVHPDDGNLSGQSSNLVGGVVLRAANQKSNDCRGQSYLDSSDPALQERNYFLFLASTMALTLMGRP